jgi:hypothetical protein
MQITTIGLDIAKNVFQVHGIDAAEKVIVKKRLRRRPIGSESGSSEILFVRPWDGPFVCAIDSMLVFDTDLFQ